MRGLLAHRLGYASFHSIKRSFRVVLAETFRSDDRVNRTRGHLGTVRDRRDDARTTDDGLSGEGVRVGKQMNGDKKEMRFTRFLVFLYVLRYRAIEPNCENCKTIAESRRRSRKLCTNYFCKTFGSQNYFKPPNRGSYPMSGY